MLATVTIMIAFSGCGNDEINYINEAGSTSTETTVLSRKGYLFGISDGVSIGMDDIFDETVMEKLGEPVEYFEAASCAFNGLDKTYTYEHFIVYTYPMDDKDYVYSIVLIDDKVSTSEGAKINMKKSEIEEIYGNDYKEDGNAIIFEKEGMFLYFMLDADVVTSVQYNSSVLN